MLIIEQSGLEGLRLLASTVGLPVGFGTTTLAVFRLLEANASAEGKKLVADWLCAQPSSNSGNYSTAFSQVIDKIFGTRPLSIRFFLRSCIASLMAIFIVSVLDLYFHHESISLDDVPLIFLFSCAASLLPDYISLLISRQIIKLMQRNIAPARVTALLALDALFKIILATGILYIGDLSLRIYWGGFSPLSGLNKHALDNVIAFYSGYGSTDVRWGVLFFASFFTSFWVWLFVLGGTLLRYLGKIGQLKGSFARFLDITKPFNAIGIAITVFGIAGAALVSVVSRVVP